MTTISPVSKNTYQTAIELLQKVNLPIKDINDHISFYTLTENEEIIGTVGVEYGDKHALLRSLSVAESRRGKGYGDQLVNFIENQAKEKGVDTMFLLTTTASDFFARKGYSITTRLEVPLFIQETSEFSSVCPASATIMKKELA
jgi:amino-acid N-acetyltransferase